MVGIKGRVEKVRDIHEEHKRHRNVLYSLVVLLIVIQIASFIVISGQVLSLSERTEKDIQEARADLQTFTLEKLNEYNKLYQQEFESIGSAIDEQEMQISREISLLKTSNQDFSGIIQEAVVGVVSVVTDKSAGSGFIISDEGYIVTNYHVIDNGDTINVLTNDEKVFRAELIGYDLTKDVALLKIPGSSYSELEIADSADIKVGEKVFAIGNPLGLSFSVTEGIISAIGRKGPNGLAEYIQTDVSLNPGNSGGPLIDTKGRVIGINNFKIGENSEGLGFALESDSFRKSVNDISSASIGKEIL